MKKMMRNSYEEEQVRKKMPYTRFSTANADYVMELEVHGLNFHDHKTVFEGIDALVLEYSGIQILTARDKIFEKNTNRKDFVDYARCKEVSLYFTDVRGGNTPSSYLNLFLQNPLSIVFLYAASPVTDDLLYSSKEARRLPKTLVALLTYAAQETLEGRNAITARKVEEHLAPLLQKRLGRKPKIGLVFGAGHAGLEYNLRYRSLREFTLWNWRNLNFRRWSGFDKELLGKVYEARHDGLEWQVTEHETGLFV